MLAVLRRRRPVPGRSAPLRFGRLEIDLIRFQATRLPSGMLRYAAPSGMHDDCVISLALAWHAVAAGGVFVLPGIAADGDAFAAGIE